MLMDPRAHVRRRDETQSRLRISGLTSLGLHVVLLAGLLLWSRDIPRSPDTSSDEGTVELVMLEQTGSQRTATPMTSPPAVAQPATPAEPQAEHEPLPLPPPPASPPTEPDQPGPPVQRPQEAPEINLSGNDSETNAIVMAGPHIIPASVDSTFHNREPVYPREAVLRGDQGAVVLQIHVSPEGFAAGVDIARSSGFQLLDRAARDAVWDWRFLPAVRDGQPIAFDMKLRVVFQLN